MYKIQIINQLSIILSTGFVEIYKYIQSPQEFLENESKGMVKEYIDGLNYLDNDTKKCLKTFYKISSEISSKYMERHKLVLTSNISDLKAYSEAVNSGIIDVKFFLEYQLKEDNIPNRLKILSFVNNHIKEIENNINDLSFFLTETPITDYSLEQAFESKNDMFISEEVLHRIYPNYQTGLLKIDNKNLNDAVFRYMIKELQKELFYEYGKEGAIEIFRDFEKLMQYLTSEPDIENLAKIALLINQEPQSIQTNEVYFVLWQLGNLYSKCFLQINDIEALIRLYEFLIENINTVNNSEYFNTDKNRIKFIDDLYCSIANLYIMVWEKDLAIEFYNKRFNLYASDNIDNEYILSHIINTINVYEKIGSENDLPDYLLSLLVNPQETLKTQNKIILTKEIITLLESQFLTIIQERELLPSTLKNYNEKLNKIEDSQLYKIINSLLTQNKLDSFELENYINSFRIDLNQLSNDLGLDTDFESDCDVLFENWRILEPDTKIIEQKLNKIETKNKTFSKNKTTLHYHLFKAKLEFLRGNRKCIELYSQIINNPSKIFDNYANSLNDYFDTTEVMYWHREYLRALSLGINENEDLQFEVFDFVKRNLDIAIIEYYENYNKPNALFFVQNIIEECIQCVLDCINQTYKNAYLHKILWSILNFKLKIIYWKSEKSNIIDSEQLNKSLKELKEKLAIFYFTFNQSEILKNEIKDIAYRIKLYQMPEFKSKSYFSLLDLPLNKTILFHLFLKQDNIQEILIFEIDLNNNLWEFNIDFSNSFYEILSNINKFKKEKSYKWESQGFSFLVQENEIRNYIYDNLILSPNINNQLTKKQDAKLYNLLQKNSNNTESTELIDLYLDDILFNIPFEFLYNDETQPFGIENKLVTVINKSQDELFINSNKSIMIFSDVDDKRINTSPERLIIEKTCNESSIRYHSFTKENATFSNFINNSKSSNYGVIHFAMHGMISEDLPYDTSCLIMQAESNELDSSLLSFQDIIQLDLSHIELVVLSCCNTAIGEIPKGSPMQGLAYAFLSAGAKCVVASRLKVGDSSTPHIMESFYNFVFKDKQSVQKSFQLTLQKFHETQNSSVKLKDLASWSIYT